MRDSLFFFSDRSSPWVGHRLFHTRTMSSNFQPLNRYVNKLWILTCRAWIQRNIQVQVGILLILIVHFTLSFVVLEVLLNAAAQRDSQEEYLRLRGQMLYIQEWKAIIYLATPVSVTDYAIEHDAKFALILVWKISMWCSILACSSMISPCTIPVEI